MAGFGASGSDDEVISGINVTPLVDVVLVLLIIFLITAPVIYRSAIKVQLPKAKTGQEIGKKNLLNFTIAKDGEVMWENTALSWDDLGRKVAKLGEQAAGQTAVISADEATPHGLVIKLMDTLREVGVTRFALSVQGEPVVPAAPKAKAQ